MDTNLPESEFAAFYKNYVQLAGAHVSRNSLDFMLQESQNHFFAALQNITREQLHFAYAPGKWTVAEVLQHLLDCEVIFLARALHIAREPGSTLPGFDENVFQTNLVEESHLQTLLADMQLQRNLTRTILRRISDAGLANMGHANGNPVSVRALFNMIVGHQMHHLNVLKERYFTNF